jgi:hypothetical protein
MINSRVYSYGNWCFTGGVSMYFRFCNGTFTYMKSSYFCARLPQRCCCFPGRGLDPVWCEGSVFVLTSLATSAQTMLGIVDLHWSFETSKQRHHSCVASKERHLSLVHEQRPSRWPDSSRSWEEHVGSRTVAAAHNGFEGFQVIDAHASGYLPLP